MSELTRRLLILTILAIPYSLWAQDQCTSSPAADYTLTAVSGSPVPESNTKGFSYTRNNDTDVLIRLEDINPFAFKCSVSTSTSDIKETAIASFLGLIGGVAGGVGGGSGSAMSTSEVVDNTLMRNGRKVMDLRADCRQAYLTGPIHREVNSLDKLRLSINGALQTTQRNQEAMLAEFNDRLHGLVELRSSARCGDTVNRAQNLMAQSLFSNESVPLPIDGNSAPSSLPIDQAIDQVALQAQALGGHLGDGLSDACKQEARKDLDEDSAFLSSLVAGTAAAPSVVENWRAYLKALNTVRSNISNAQKSIGAVLANRQNFVIDTSVHGNQQVVTYTATCSPIPPQTVLAPDPSASLTSTAPTTSLTTDGGTTPTPTAKPWKHDFKFGLGPRFVYAGGIVISPLQQVSFSTTATPGGSGATANTIIQQQNSSTRILPIAMLHARFWDQLPPKIGYFWLPNYFSAGVTAKSSDNKGTNIEYLFGPSWSFAERQIFFTAGAYAGQQQRLANSLMVGSTTNLSSSNLPITQSTIWKVGFAVTWAPGGK